jgi:hypothetical protein
MVRMVEPEVARASKALWASAAYLSAAANWGPRPKPERIRPTRYKLRSGLHSVAQLERLALPFWFEV